MFIVGNLGPALALDRMGRRKTMLYGCFGLGICMMMASILLSFGKKNTSSAAVAFFFVYMIIVSCALLLLFPIRWLCFPFEPISLSGLVFFLGLSEKFRSLDCFPRTH